MKIVFLIAAFLIGDAAQAQAMTFTSYFCSVSPANSTQPVEAKILDLEQTQFLNANDRRYVTAQITSGKDAHGKAIRHLELQFYSGQRLDFSASAPIPNAEHAEITVYDQKTNLEYSCFK